jgi:hypothetical protein
MANPRTIRKCYNLTFGASSVRTGVREERVVDDHVTSPDDDRDRRPRPSAAARGVDVAGEIRGIRYQHPLRPHS